MELSDLSEGLFGRQMRLPLLMWIRKRNDPLFFITEAQKATGFDHAHIVKELNTLVDLRSLAKLPTERKNDRQYFRREDSSSVWRFADLALELVAGGDLTDSSVLSGAVTEKEHTFDNSGLV